MESFKKINFLFLLLLSVFTLPVFADTDKPDSSIQQYYDSTQIVTRHFDEATIDELKNDGELVYTADRATVSLFERLWRLFQQLLYMLFSETASTELGTIVIYILAVVILVYVIITLMKLDAVKIFFSGGKQRPIDHTIIEENIHEMDFDKLIEAAIANKDYRLAIRLYFLQGLKQLSDKQLIHWEPGKTNHDYLNELGTSELKKDFRELNFYFEYAWYGYFDLTPDLFLRVKEKFTAWKIKL